MFTPPKCLAHEIDWLAMENNDDLIWYIRIQLDLIEEGQDGTHYTKREVNSIKKWLAKHPLYKLTRGI